MKIIKFTALWCADCIVMRAAWREIVEKFPGVEIVEYDFDDQKEKAKELGAAKVPFNIFYDKAGNEIARIEGMQNKSDLIRLIEENIDN